MDLALSPRAEGIRHDLLAFMDEHIYPNESVWHEQVLASRETGDQPAIVEELKGEARKRGLWNLFLPDSHHGAGLTNCEYAPLAEIMGRVRMTSEICNSNAPDTGNMEVLHQFGTAEQKERWLEPLLDGRIRSSFCMTEPGVASSDATNIGMSIVRDGDEYVLNGRKWWSTNIFHPHNEILVVMGKTDPDAETHRQQSMVLVPRRTPGVELVRDLTVFGYHDTGGHGEVQFTDVRVPVENILVGEGDGFMIAQARLGPGRIHHCMRAIGMAERALELMCERADARVAFGRPVSDHANVRDWIAEARIDLEMARLLVMKTAWLMDTVGNRHARIEISGIKFAVPNICLKIVDRAIQVHGGGGVSQDFPLAAAYAHLRTLRLADGPDEVHKMSLARQELKRQRQRRRAD